MHPRHSWKRHEWGIGYVRDVQNGELLGVRGKKGSPGNGNNEFVERTVFVSRTEGAPATQPVTLRGRNISRLEQDFPAGSQVLGHVGGGLEYRFTPRIGIFGEVGYDFPNLSNNNFIQTNFGLRFAF
jgi:hypothetical protein